MQSPLSRCQGTRSTSLPPSFGLLGPWAHFLAAKGSAPVRFRRSDEVGYSPAVHLRHWCGRGINTPTALGRLLERRTSVGRLLEAPNILYRAAITAPVDLSLLLRPAWREEELFHLVFDDHLLSTAWECRHSLRLPRSSSANATASPAWECRQRPLFVLNYASCL